MAWIKIIDEQEAKGDLAEYYKEARAQGRTVPNVHTVLSLNPGAMRAIDAFQRTWREDGVLSGRHREMVAVVTSALNRCHY